jgi:hypothetical protein
MSKNFASNKVNAAHGEGARCSIVKIRENVHGNATQPTKAADGLGEQRTANELVKLIRKLRWMGLERDAEKVENQLILRKVQAADSVIAASRETD